MKGETTMRRTIVKQRLVAAFCLLMLTLLLLLSACGGYSSPGSQPNGTPQATPTKGGYSIISLLDNEIEFLLAPQRR